MQKLDFVQAVEKVYKDMLSEEVVFDIETSMTPGISKYGTELAPKLFEMYSNYNALKKDKQYAAILSALNGDELFNSENISNLFKLFQGDIGQIDFLKNREFKLFLNFHYTLHATVAFIKKILTDKKIKESINEGGVNGIVIFEVFNDSDGLSTKIYVKILEALEALAEVVSAVEGEKIIEPKVILLDSGSNTNIGIETGVKTASTIFQTFKQIYDFFRFRKHDGLERDNKALMDSLEVLSAIKTKVDSGVISPEDGQLYSHKIKIKTNELLRLNVMPKELTQDLTNINIIHFLNRGPAGLLTEGEDVINDQ